MLKLSFFCGQACSGISGRTRNELFASKDSLVRSAANIKRGVWWVEESGDSENIDIVCDFNEGGFYGR
ncbi:hypothetical protein HYY75_08620 [bacterium]|nr:hypothetical protein [bacterium]